MNVQIILGIGAGLVSALLFAAVGTGSIPAMLLLYLSPLPILIVSLGWHHLLGLLALAVGGFALSVLVRPTAGLAFALGPALSAWLLAYLALLVRPATATASGPGLPGVQRWFPVGHLLLWIGVAGALVAICSLTAASGGDFDRYQAALEQAASSFVGRPTRRGRAGGALPDGLALPGPDFVRTMVLLAPGLLAAMLTIILAANLWLAGRTVAISGRLTRAWPDIPAARMPVAAIAIGAAGLVTAPMSGFPGIAGTAVVGGIAMAFALQGLAVVHFMSRGRSGRGLILAFTYVMTIALGSILMPAFALLGIADTAFPIRRALGGGTKPPPPPLPPGPRT